MQRLAWIAERKSSTWMLHMPKDWNIKSLLVEGRQNKHLTDLSLSARLLYPAYSHGSARCTILLQFSLFPVEVRSTVLYCEKALSSLCCLPPVTRSVTTLFPCFWKTVMERGESFFFFLSLVPPLPKTTFFKSCCSRALHPFCTIKVAFSLNRKDIPITSQSVKNPCQNLPFRPN